MVIQQTFLQEVSQSRYTNLIDGHASLKRSQSAKAKRFSRTIVNNISEAYTWLKSPPRGLGLEKCSRVFESRGFVTLSSLKHLRPGDIDAFFPSPEKLLLAEKHVLESEIKGMIDQESRILSLWPQRFNSYSDTWENYYASSSYQTAPWNQSLPPNILPTTTAACNTAERSIAGGQEIKPLDRKRDEMKENLLLLHLTLLTTFKYVWILFSLNKGILAEMSKVSDRRDRKLP